MRKALHTNPIRFEKSHFTVPLPLMKPTLLLVHGAFSLPSCFNGLVPYLYHAGYSTQRADYPSANPRDPFTVTAQGDINYLRNQVLLPLVEQQQNDVIIVAHSYGGAVAGGAAVGLSKSDRRAQNRPGGVLGLIYVSGNIVHEGSTLIESAGGKAPTWLLKDKPRKGLAVIEPLVETLCQDCNASERQAVEATCVPQGYMALSTKVSAQAWAQRGFSNRLAYVRTTEDRVNPVSLQDSEIQGSGVHWDVVTMQSSHAPYFSHPAELANYIVNFSAKFEAL